MAKKLQLSLACGDYEIVRPLKLGLVEPEGIELNVLNIESRERHWRMGRNEEFDICEFNYTSHAIAIDQGRPFIGLPIFLHRRFRHGFIFINKDKGIEKPADLIGKKVGGATFAPASNVWIRGILEDQHGVLFKEMIYLTERDDDIDFEIAEGLRIERIPATKSLDRMLADGEIDAMFSATFPQSYLDGDPNIGRLFEDYKDVEAAYFRDTGIFPIMHVNTIRRDIVERHPWVPGCLVEAFEKSKNMAYERVQNPRIVPLAWFSHAWEEQRAVLGDDPWEYGLGARNRKNLETGYGYAHRQGLISRPMPLDELFVDTGEALPESASVSY